MNRTSTDLLINADLIPKVCVFNTFLYE